ncbi:hypothetical protein J2Y74_002622 [Pseudomonas migulae]|nr:hypothetical protein [Pseudomonas migulae]
MILACSTLLGFGRWWRARWQPAILRAAQTGPSPRTVLDDLMRVCQANDSHATRQALDAWTRQQPENLPDMAARFVPLSDARRQWPAAALPEITRKPVRAGLLAIGPESRAALEFAIAGKPAQVPRLLIRLGTSPDQGNFFQNTSSPMPGAHSPTCAVCF